MATEWEHSVFAVPADEDLKELQEGLDRTGEAGWELAAVVVKPERGEQVLYFKRPKQEPKAGNPDWRQNLQTITVGEFRERLESFPDHFTLDFSTLEFYRLKQRGENLVQVEFGQQVYRDRETGEIIVEDVG